MSKPDQEPCFFRNLEQRGVPDFGSDPMIGQQVCSVGSCTLRLGDLLAYTMAGGADAPRQRIDEQVDPSCSILDVPHQMDTDLAQAMDALGPPLDPPNRYQ